MPEEQRDPPREENRQGSARGWYQNTNDWASDSGYKNWRDLVLQEYDPRDREGTKAWERLLTEPGFEGRPRSDMEILERLAASREKPRMRTTPSGTACTWCEEVARLMVSVIQKDEMPQLRDTAIRRAVQEDRGIVRKVLAGDIHLMETMCDFINAHNIEGGHDALWGDVLSRSEVKTTGAEKLIAKWAGMELVFSVSLTAEIARIGIENM